MKRNTFTPEQISKILKEFEAGKSAAEISWRQSGRQPSINGVNATAAWMLKR